MYTNSMNMKPISEHAKYPSLKTSEHFIYYISQCVTLKLESIFIEIKALKSLLKAKYYRNKENSHSFSYVVVTKTQLHPFLTIILDSFLVANNS